MQLVPFGMITPGKAYFVETTAGEHKAVRAMDFPRPTEDGDLVATVRAYTSADDLTLNMKDVKNLYQS